MKKGLEGRPVLTPFQKKTCDISKLNQKNKVTIINAAFNSPFIFFYKFFFFFLSSIYLLDYESFLINFKEAV